MTTHGPELAALAPAEAPCRGPLGVAVSGGGDSVALARALLAAGWPPAELHLLHVRHGLRPEAEAEREAAVVAGLAQRFGTGFRERALAWPKGRLPNADAVRRARYGAIAEWIDELGLAGVALAHTADDQRETRWLAMARGAGLRGLAGMRPWSSPWWRPLLGVPRGALRSALADWGEAWIDDRTNTDFRHPRARLRHLLLPALARPLTGVEALRVRLLQDEDAYLDASAAAAGRGLCRGAELVVGEDWAGMDPVLQRRLLRQWLPGRAGAERVEALRSALAAPAAARLRQFELGAAGRVWVGAERAVAAGGLPAATEVAPGRATVVTWGALGELEVAGGEGGARIVPAGHPEDAEDALRETLHQNLRNADVPAPWRAVWPLVHWGSVGWSPEPPLGRASGHQPGSGQSAHWRPGAAVQTAFAAPTPSR